MQKHIKYTLNFHVGTPSDSRVVHSVEFDARNDLEADKVRRAYEDLSEFEYDFNLLSQSSYLEQIKDK